MTSEDYYVGNIYEESYSVDSSSPTISASTTTVTNVYAGSIRVAGLTIQTTATGTENNTLYYHGDHLGSSSIITDGTGTVVRDISYQPWGNVQSNTEESGASTLDPKHKFTGQILDESTDLYYYGARYYDPALRRFITPDTIVQNPYDPQSLNRYAYCRNNPLIYVDPSGHFVLELIGIAILANVGYHATQGDIHNWNDAWRYTYQGAAWGAGAAALVLGAQAAGFNVEFAAYLEDVKVASYTLGEAGNTLSAFGYGGAGLTGAIQLAQLATPNWPMYAQNPNQANDAGTQKNLNINESSAYSEWWGSLCKEWDYIYQGDWEGVWENRKKWAENVEISITPASLRVMGGPAGIGVGKLQSNNAKIARTVQKANFKIKSNILVDKSMAKIEIKARPEPLWSKILRVIHGEDLPEGPNIWGPR